MGSKKEWATLSDSEWAKKLTKYMNAELTNAHVSKVGYTLDPTVKAGNAEFDFQN